MSTLDTLIWFQNTAAGQTLSQADHLVGAVLQIVHIAGFLLLLSVVVLANLRLLGVGLRLQTVDRVARATQPLLWAGLGAAVLSGAIIFLSSPVHYYPNSAFWIKLGLLLVAVAVQSTMYRAASGLNGSGSVNPRLVAVASLVLWFGVGIAGRAIGFI